MPRAGLHKVCRYPFAPQELYCNLAEKLCSLCVYVCFAHCINSQNVGSLFSHTVGSLSVCKKYSLCSGKK